MFFFSLDVRISPDDPQADVERGFHGRGTNEYEEHDKDVNKNFKEESK